jgi:hypothetical protein
MRALLFFFIILLISFPMLVLLVLDIVSGYDEDNPAQRVQEISGYVAECGIDIPPVDIVVSKDHCLGVAGCIVPFGNHSTIWVKPEEANSNYLIAHEMAHQVLFTTEPGTDMYHHEMLKFHQWEVCLTLSADFDTNLCGMMK